MKSWIVPGLTCMVLLCGRGAAARADDHVAAKAALGKAVGFFHMDVARHGGYVYAYSGDLKLREGEGVAGDDVIWVQPPGTPAVGEAFLDAYEATGDARCLEAARDAAHALARGQLYSGGWHYQINFAPAKRQATSFRYGPDWRPLPLPHSAEAGRKVGWDEWKKRKYKGNLTVLDDDTTQAATRFLVRFDKVAAFEDDKVHGAAGHALASLLLTQYPNGAWSASYDRFPAAPPPAEHYPVKAARYPADWPRTWPKDFRGCYVTNDNLIADVIDTMLLAAGTYGEEAEQYLASARRAGDFLLLAQMPEPQPAWAQQYDRDMTPVWSRAFEPPAISGGESQGVLEALLRLYVATGDEKYLKPVPAALKYLRGSLRPDGKLARFYELKTNRPIYFERGPDGKHRMTYSDANLADGYGYVVDSKLDRIERDYQRALEGKTNPPSRRRGPLSPELVARARKVIDAMDARGAWVQKGRLRHHKVEPESGVIESRTFVRNVRTLCDLIRAVGQEHEPRGG